MVLATLAQDPVKARLRGDIHTLIREARDDLAGREACKSLAVAGRRDPVTLLFAQLAGRRRTMSDRAQVFPDRAIRGAPALHCASIKGKFCAG
jgi:hypothetical protein